MPTVYIDGQSYEVTKGRNMLDVALSLGFDLPYFCWHPAMGSVGACRQCAVVQYRDENDKKGKLAVACMIPAADGTKIGINSVEAIEFRARVIEWLMVNHPHDCPVCDEGGECHLQDMTVMAGHNYRRYRFTKRTFRNQYLGPFINHEMNRCIACYRCVRFYRDYAGGTDLNVFGAHDHVFFGRHKDGVLENEFSGNLVEVCPTGVFTDKTLKRHYTRKWDLRTAPSVCQHCGLGCNTIPGERYGTLRRILNRYNYEVNGYFLCDRGRFGYEFVESSLRIRQPLFRESSRAQAKPISKAEALTRAATLISGNRIIGIGSPRASLESNYALKQLVGEDNYYSGLSRKDSELVRLILDVLRNGPAASASMHDVQAADAALVLGEDLTNTAPMLALQLRQATLNKPMKQALKLGIQSWNDAAVRELVQDDRGPVFVATPAKSRTDEVASGTFRGTGNDIALLGFAVAHAIDRNTPAPNDVPQQARELAHVIADALKTAESPVIIAGMSLRNEAIIRAAANIAWSLAKGNGQVRICFTVPECNTMGSGYIGGGDLEKAFELAKAGKVDTAIILENDLYRRADSRLVDEFLGNCKNVVVLDHMTNPTASKANLVIPAGTFAESSGTLLNNEGRAQRFFRVFEPHEMITESWRWIKEMMQISAGGEAERWQTLDDITNEICADIADFKQRAGAAFDASFRIHGQKIAREPHRYSGRTAMNAYINVHEPQPPEDPDSPLGYSMEGYHGLPPPSLIPYYWAPGWNSVQATNKYQSEINGPLRGGDPGIRLFEPDKDRTWRYFREMPFPFELKPEQGLVEPLYHIFGSEELSINAEGIAERVPKPYIGVNAAAVKNLDASIGDEFVLSISGKETTLPLLIVEGLPDGVAGLPVGLPGLEWIELPAWGKLRRAS